MRHNCPALLLALVISLPMAASAQATPASAPATHSATAQLPADSMQLGRKYVMWLYTARADSLLAHMDSASKAQPNMARMIEDGSARLAASAGTEEKVLEEKFITRNGNRQYWRKAQFSNMSEPFLVRIVMNARGEMAGVGMGPASQAPPIDP